MLGLPLAPHVKFVSPKKEQGCSGGIIGREAVPVARVAAPAQKTLIKPALSKVRINLGLEVRYLIQR